MQNYQVKVYKRPNFRRSQTFVAVTNRIPTYSAGDVINNTDKSDPNKKFIANGLLIWYFKNFHVGQQGEEWTKLALNKFNRTGRKSMRHIRVDNQPKPEQKLTVEQQVEQQNAECMTEQLAHKTAEEAALEAQEALEKAKEIADQANKALEEALKGLNDAIDAKEKEIEEKAEAELKAVKDAEKAKAKQAEADAKKILEGLAGTADPAPEPEKPKKKKKGGAKK